MSIVVLVKTTALRPIPTALEAQPDATVVVLVALDVLPAPRPVPTVVEAQLDATVVVLVTLDVLPAPRSVPTVVEAQLDAAAATAVVVAPQDATGVVAVVVAVVVTVVRTVVGTADDTVVVLEAPRPSTLVVSPVARTMQIVVAVIPISIPVR